MKKEIDVRCSTGIEKVNAWCEGHFGVHQVMLSNGLFGMDYCVTHLPSGIRFSATYADREAALGAAREFNKLRDDWDTLDPWTVTPEFKRRVANIATRFGGHYGLRDPDLDRRTRAEYTTDLNGYRK